MSLYECCICLENINEPERYILQCDHNYHTDCIMKWFSQDKKTCPTCRDRIDGKEDSSCDYYMSGDSSDEYVPNVTQWTGICWACHQLMNSNDLIRINVRARVKPVHRRCQNGFSLAE